MAIAGFAVLAGGMWAACKIIDWLGGDPEGDVASEMAKYEGLSQMQQQMPAHRMRRQLTQMGQREAGLSRRMTDMSIEAGEAEIGARVPGPRDLLESVSQQLGVAPEDLGRRLSPQRAGDFSSLSRAAFGRSAKRMGQENG